MKLLSKSGLISAAVMLLTLPAVPVAAMGMGGEHVTTTSSTSTTESEADMSTPMTANSDASESKTETRQNNSDAKKAAAKAKASEAKLKSCQNHQKVVTSTMARISDRGQKQIDLFTKIANRTEQFYTEKGKTLSNYQALVNDVDAKHSAAQAQVDSIANASTNFTCDGTNDKAKVTAFKSSMKAEISAIKDYKTAVKNLIVGVKSVQSTTTSDSTTKTTTGGNQ